jgi:tetratricopeptide (TPR) repeat protein
MKRILIALAALTAAVPALAADKKVEDAYAKADSQLAKGRTEEAEKTMEKLVQGTPTAEAHTYRSRIQLKAGNVEGAATSAAEAAKLADSATPEVKAEALAHLSSLDLERGSGKDALAHAQAAVAASASAASLAALARAQARLGDPAAVETGNKAVAAGATSAAAHEALGHALLAMQRGDDAAAAFRKALELEPKRASAGAGLANALVATGKAAEAVTVAKKATEDNDKSGEAFAAYANALYAAAPNKEQGWGEAINQAQQGAFVSPRNPVVLTSVARLFENGGNLDQAATNLRKALEVDPGYVPAQLQLLQIESRKGDLAAAIARAKSLAQTQPQNLDVQLTLGKLLARNGDWDEAAVALGKVAVAMPSSAEVQALAGTAFQFTGQSDDALVAYKKAVQLAPSNNDYRSTYGLLLGLNKQYAEGITELTKVTSSPGYKDAAGWVNLGWLYRNVDPPKAAESANAYQKALQIDPKNSQAALGLAWAQLTAQQYDQAIVAFTKAMELDKANAIVSLNGIGWSHYFKKDMAKAEEYFKQAAAAGRGDARLAEAIKNFRERGEAELERQRQAQIANQRQESQGGDVDSLCGQLAGGGGVGAAAKLGSMGKPAVSCLIWATRNASSMAVQQAAARALGNIGGAAREACPHLQSIARNNPYETTMMDAKQQDLWVRYEDLRRAARGSIGKIGCGG